MPFDWDNPAQIFFKNGPGGEIKDAIDEKVGDLTGENAREQERIAQEQRLKQMQAIDTLEGQAPTLEQLTPEYEQEWVTQDMLLGPSRAAGARADSRAVGAQMRALEAMQDVYRQGGMTAADKARLQQAQFSNAQQMRSQREGIMANAAERGMGGSGAELAALLTGAQGGANAMANENAQIQQAAQQRALQAMQGAGSVAGQARGQSFTEAYNRGLNADAVNRSNVDYRRGVQTRNVGTRNTGADRRTEAQRDLYGTRERIAAMRTGQYQQQHDDARERAQSSRDTQNAIIGGAAGWAGL